MNRRLAVLLLALAGCGDEAPQAVAPPALTPLIPESVVGTAGKPRSLILLVLDTLRADHTSVHGYERPTTPFLEQLAARGIVFERAYSNASWTRASMATLFSSRLPESHGCEGRTGVLGEDVTTLPEVLDAAGFETVGLTANGNLAEAFGFAQGYDSYKFIINKGDPAVLDPPYANAAKLEKPVHERIKDLPKDRPFFFYVHYVDPHDPYYPHPETDFDPGYAGDFIGAREQLKPFTNKRPAEDVVRRARDLYDGAILWLDQHLATLFTSLARRDLLDDAWVVVTSDHGEGLWTHRTQAHGGEVYEEQIHVPLILVPPGGLAQGVRIRQPIALIDLAPTLAELVGSATSPEFEGRSWAPYLLGRDRAPMRPIVIDEDLDTIDLSAIVDGHRKVIRDDGNRRLHAFDLATNPGEDLSRAIDLKGQGGAAYKDLVDLLVAELRRAAERRGEAAEAADVSEEVREHLDAMGYVGGDHDDP